MRLPFAHLPATSAAGRSARRASSFVAVAVVAAGAIAALGGCSDSTPPLTSPPFDSASGVKLDLSTVAEAPDLASAESDDLLVAAPDDLAASDKPDLKKGKDGGGGGGKDMAKAGDMKGGGGDMAGPKQHVINVGMGGNKFVPATLGIGKGDKVRFVWKTSGHNVVSGSNATPDGRFCNPSDTDCANAPLAPKATVYERVFTAAGSYPYFCAPHAKSGMTGTIIVK